jgi:3-oxoacyl-ACP reductase-like protein
VRLLRRVPILLVLVVVLGPLTAKKSIDGRTELHGLFYFKMERSSSEKSMHRFEGKVVIVTGAGSGIGAGSARRFLQEGAFVTLNGRREHKLRETIDGFDAARSLVLWRRVG